mmetsp:Transcript_9388/g.32001  ORF Transcript_9388/g.32001 Transcript_9388/m.32001 type:complete len:283 (+) Transcript_9388:218-1066(+)
MRPVGGRSLELLHDDAVEEVEGHRRLVHGHHVAGLVHTHEGEAAAGLDLANLRVVEHERVHGGRVESLLAAPLQRLSPRTVAVPVANEVLVAGVDGHGNAALEEGNEAVLLLLHPVVHHEAIDEVGALLPLGALAVHVEGRTGGVLVHEGVHHGEVVAEGALAVLGNVVHVQATPAVRGLHGVVAEVVGLLALGRVLLAGLALGLARLDGRDHVLILRLRDGLDAVAVVVGHLGVVRVLDRRVRQAVPNTHARKVDGHVAPGKVLVAVVDGLSHGRGVVPAI